MLDDRVVADQRLAQRHIQRSDRAVALGGGVVDLPAHAHLDRGFGEDAASLAVFDDDREVDQLKGRLCNPAAGV